MFDFVRFPNPIEHQSFDWVRLDICSILFDWYLARRVYLDLFHVKEHYFFLQNPFSKPRATSNKIFEVEKYTQYFREIWALREWRTDVVKVKQT